MRRKIPLRLARIAVAVAAGLRSPSRPLSARRRPGGRRTVAVSASGRPQVPRHDGLGRPRLHQELQPLYRRRAAERLDRAGRVLRAADRHGRGGLKTESVARPQLEVEQRQQDAHAEPRHGTRSGRTASRSPRPTSSTASLAGRQDKIDGPDRPDRRRQQHRLGQGEGHVQRRHQAEDARLAVHLGDAQPRSSSSRSTSGRRSRTSATFTNPNPVGSGPFNRIARFTAQDYVLEQEPELLAEGAAEDRVPRVRAGVLERRCARADPERPGRLDAQLRPERREGVQGEGHEALPRVLLDDRDYPISLVFDTTKYPYSLVAFRKARQPGDRPQDGLEARRVRLRAARPTRSALERALPGVGDRPRR